MEGSSKIIKPLKDGETADRKAPSLIVEWTFKKQKKDSSKNGNDDCGWELH